MYFHMKRLPKHRTTSNLKHQGLCIRGFHLLYELRSRIQEPCSGRGSSLSQMFQGDGDAPPTSLCTPLHTVPRESREVKRGIGLWVHAYPAYLT
jgi:hypothetical protein